MTHTLNMRVNDAVRINKTEFIVNNILKHNSLSLDSFRFENSCQCQVMYDKVFKCVPFPGRLSTVTVLTEFDINLQKNELSIGCGNSMRNVF